MVFLKIEVGLFKVSATLSKIKIKMIFFFEGGGYFLDLDQFVRQALF